MPFAVCSWDSGVSCVLAVSVCLQTGVVLGDSRTHLVVQGADRNSGLSSKTQTRLLGQLQTLVEFALSFILSSRCHVEPFDFTQDRLSETFLIYSLEQNRLEIDPGFFASFRMTV
jgi:hypothetical protein